MVVVYCYNTSNNKDHLRGRSDVIVPGDHAFSDKKGLTFENEEIMFSSQLKYFSSSLYWRGCTRGIAAVLSVSMISSERRYWCHKRYIAMKSGNIREWYIES